MDAISKNAVGLAAPTRGLRQGLAAGLLALTLAACGGGGGGDSSSTPSEPAVGPPATAASIGTSGSDATDVVKAAVSGADAVANRYTSMTGFAGLLGVPVAIGDVAPTVALQWLNRRPANDGRAYALDVTTAACADVVDAPCSGTAVLDTNISATATTVSAGNYVEVLFNNISGYVLGRPVTMTGRMRIEFLSAVNLNSSQLTGVSMRLKFTAFGGTVAGYSFGPVTEVLDLSINSAGVPTLVASGVRYGSLATVTVSGSGSFSIGSGSVRAAFGSAGTGYADLTLTNWRHSAGRPVVGSQATVSAGSASATVQVTSSSATVVVYTVTLTTGAGSASYSVTATYPAGGGAPTYLAVPMLA